MSCRVRRTIGWGFLPAGLALTVMVSLAGPAAAATYTITPGGTSLSSFVNTLQPGDIVEVQPGAYNDIMKITANGTTGAPIIIRGVGGSMPVFDATGKPVTGAGSVPRAIFQIQGAYIQIENLEFKNGRNSEGNGSGIRLLNSTNVVIKNCKIDYNDMGMMGNDTVRALIEGSDIGFNGTTTNGMDGYSHNLYMDGAGAIVLKGNYVHDALYGQNFKSRAHYNELWYNWISGSNEGEIGPVQGAYTTTPNSNFLMVGNTVVSKSDRTGNHMKYVNFGQDGTDYTHNGTMYLFNNTLIAKSTSNAFVWVSDLSDTGQVHAVAKNNLFYGSNNIVYSGTPSGTVTGSDNWIPTAGIVAPGVFTDSVVGSNPQFVDPANLDYELMQQSLCADQGTSDLTYYDGNGVVHTVVPDYSYLLGEGMVPRVANGPLDIGAYEVPEPATLALLAMGGLAMLSRRAIRRRA